MILSDNLGLYDHNKFCDYIENLKTKGVFGWSGLLTKKGVLMQFADGQQILLCAGNSDMSIYTKVNADVSDWTFEHIDKSHWGYSGEFKNLFKHCDEKQLVKLDKVIVEEKVLSRTLSQVTNINYV